MKAKSKQSRTHHHKHSRNRNTVVFRCLTQADLQPVCTGSIWTGTTRFLGSRTTRIQTKSLLADFGLQNEGGCSSQVEFYCPLEAGSGHCSTAQQAANLSLSFSPNHCLSLSLSFFHCLFLPSLFVSFYHWSSLEPKLGAAD